MVGFLLYHTSPASSEGISQGIISRIFTSVLSTTPSALPVLWLRYGHTDNFIKHEHSANTSNNGAATAYSVDTASLHRPNTNNYVTYSSTAM